MRFKQIAITKNEFMAKPSIAKLSKQEAESRWKQHLADAQSGVSVRKKEIRQTLKASGIQSRLNPYLQSLLDPEEAGKGIGVPDEFSPPTFKLQQIINMPMPVDENGRFCAIVRPTARRTVGVAVSNTVDRYNLLSNLYDEGIGATQVGITSTNPLHQQDFDSEKITSQVTSTFLVYGSTPNMSFQGCFPSGLVGTNSYPSYYMDPSVGYLYAYDENSADGNDVTLTARLSYVQIAAEPAAPGAMQIEYQCYDSNFNLLGNGIIANTSQAQLANGDIIAYWNHSQVDIYTACGSHGQTAYWGFVAIQNTTVTGSDVRVASITAWLQRTNQTTALNFPFLSSPLVSQWVDCPDVNTMLSDFQNLRPVSMSVWANYRGNVLENDSIAAKLVYTNGYPMEQNTPVTNYDFLSKCVDGYNGPLNTGAYVLWRPTTFDQATAWRSPYTAEWYRLPYASISGHMPSGGVVNLRVVINFEAQTNETLFALTVTPYSAGHLQEAFAALSRFPSSMENSTHAARIRDFLVGVAKGVYNARIPLISSIAGATGNPGVGAGLGALASALPNWR